MFFSYSQDNNIDDNLLNEIREYIESMSNNRINVIYDKKSFHSGDNVIERENEILTCDSMDSFDEKETQEKFRILYKLGVIGIYLDKKEASKHGYGYHICYVFNEGLKVCNDVLKGDLDKSRIKVIFNTIFLKLGLNANTNELICDYDWNYISKNHLMKDTIDRI